MKALIIAASISLAFLAGCITMPDPVPDAYLVEKSNDDNRLLDRLATAIIAKNHELKASKVKLADAEDKLQVERGRVDILKSEKELLASKQKQYELEKDAAKIEENSKAMAEKDGQIEVENSRVDYAAAFLDNARAARDVSETGLSVLVAELNYEKSKIAKAYLLKQEPAAKEGETRTRNPFAPGPDKYDEQYEKYLNKQRETLADRKNELEKAAVRLKIAENNLKK